MQESPGSTRKSWTFSRMRSKDSRFDSLWGCGARAVFSRRCATVRNRPQPFATVRNRPQPSATVRNRSQPFATVRARSLWLCLWQPGSFLDIFGVFPLRVASFRVAGVALCGIPTCFMTCQEYPGWNFHYKPRGLGSYVK